VDPVHQRAAERWSLDGEPVDRIFDEIGTARVVRGQVDEPNGHIHDQQDLPRTHTGQLNPQVKAQPGPVGAETPLTRPAPRSPGSTNTRTSTPGSIRANRSSSRTTAALTAAAIRELLD
jgi:hypothetical protein